MRGAAGAVEAGEVGLRARLAAEDGERFLKDAGGGEVAGLGDAVMHPLAFAAGFHEAGAAQIGKVAGDLGLALAQDLDEIADADFAAVHQV